LLARDQYGDCHRPALDTQRPDTLDAAKAGFRAAWKRPLSVKKADEICST
jgi:hypothetical protein